MSEEFDEEYEERRRRRNARNEEMRKRKKKQQMIRMLMRRLFPIAGIILAAVILIINGRSIIRGIQGMHKKIRQMIRKSTHSIRNQEVRIYQMENYLLMK